MKNKDIEIIEEFRKRFHGEYFVKEAGGYSKMNEMIYRGVEAFLKSALQKQREESEKYKGKIKRQAYQLGFKEAKTSTLREVEEKVKKMRKEPILKLGSEYEDHCVTYNSALNEVLQTLKDKEKA